MRALPVADKGPPLPQALGENALLQSRKGARGNVGEAVAETVQRVQVHEVPNALGQLFNLVVAEMQVLQLGD